MRHSSMCRGKSQFLVGHSRITRKTLGFVIVLMALLQLAHGTNVLNDEHCCSPFDQVGLLSLGTTRVAFI